MTKPPSKLRPTTLRAVEAGIDFPILRHAACDTPIELRRMLTGDASEGTDVLWCSACARAVPTDQLVPPGPVCYVED